MGAWDEGSFGNDSAMDFVGELENFDTVRTTIARLEQSEGTLDADEACVGLAACDLVAAAMGRAPEDLPDVPDFSNEKIADDLLILARSLITKIRKTSELAELWAEDDDTKWQKGIDALLQRLDPSAPYIAPKKKREKLPKDFLGHCYVCYGPVTKRDGILFEHNDGFATSTTHPHRACIEKKVNGTAWNDDGTPTQATRNQLLRDMGYDVD